MGLAEPLDPTQASENVQNVDSYILNCSPYRKVAGGVRTVGGSKAE
jgi:hypothetical protein